MSAIEQNLIRSQLQNKYWWAAVVPLVMKGLIDAGYNEVKTKEDAHTVLKLMFLKKYFKESEDFTTRTLSPKEFKELIETVQQFGAEYLAIYIPDPEK